jgi:UDP-N-acetylglucosamine/UDP-N-acetylgalactosamine diphosphorylase
VLKVPGEVDQILVAKTFEAGQEHVFDFWDELSEAERRQLLDQLASIDFQLLGRLGKLIDVEPPPPAGAQGIPTELVTGERRAALEARGWQALRAGKVACLVVAGGQGTRLGWDHPKGTFPASPVLEKSLFQLFAEQVLAISRRAGAPLRWYVLTSRQNRAETEAFFSEHQRFGLLADQVTFLVQREVPTVDARGKLLMTGKAEIAMTARCARCARRARSRTWPSAGSRRCSTSRSTTRCAGSPTRRSSARTSRPAPRPRRRSCARSTRPRRSASSPSATARPP